MSGTLSIVRVQRGKKTTVIDPPAQNGEGGRGAFWVGGGRGGTREIFQSRVWHLESRAAVMATINTQKKRERKRHGKSPETGEGGRKGGLFFVNVKSTAGIGHVRYFP